MMLKKDGLFCFDQLFYFMLNIGNCVGVVVNMVGLNAVYNEVKQKTSKLVFAASLLYKQH